MPGTAGVASSGLGPVDGVRPYHGLILGRPSCCFRTGLSSGRGLGGLNLYRRGLACLPVISQASQALAEAARSSPSPRKRHATRRRDGKTFPRLSGAAFCAQKPSDDALGVEPPTRIGMMRTAAHGMGLCGELSCGWWPFPQFPSLPSWRRDGPFVSSLWSRYLAWTTARARSAATLRLARKRQREVDRERRRRSMLGRSP